MSPGRLLLFERSFFTGRRSVGRSGKIEKVREDHPNTLGIRFGELVREYMVIRGLQNQDVALKVYKDEERKSSVSDVLNGRAANPTPDTISRYSEALGIPPDKIQALFSASRLENIQADIAALAKDRQADRRTM